MVRLTVQKYFTPTGRCIQKPYDEGSEAYHKERYERFEKGELFNLDSLHLPDSLKYFTKYKKRVVYGGGGILPDIFVPVDTSYSSEYFSNLIRKGVINSWALTYVDKNRPQLQKQFSTIKSFISGFKMSASMHSELLSQAEKEEIVFNEEEYQRSKYAIELRIKALIGRNLFENGDFYRIINDMNPAFKKGLEILKDGTFDRMKIADNG
jgi:carboxyl-terminal processing protease